MATVLDVGLIQYFDVVFPVLLVFALVFALLHKTKVIGDAPGINAIIAVASAMMILLSDTIVDMINFMIPWFVIVIIFFILMILIFQMFGLKEASLESAVKDKSVYWAIIGISAVIIVAAFGSVLGQSFTEASFQEGEVIETAEGGVATASFEQNITATLFHPKMLGLMVIFAIVIFAVALLSG